MAAFDILLRPEEGFAIVRDWASYLTTATTGAHQRDLGFSGYAILVSEPSTLELWVARNGWELMELEFVDLCVCGKREKADNDWNEGEQHGSMWKRGTNHALALLVLREKGGESCDIASGVTHCVISPSIDANGYAFIEAGSKC